MIFTNDTMFALLTQLASANCANGVAVTVGGTENDIVYSSDASRAAAAPVIAAFIAAQPT